MKRSIFRRFLSKFSRKKCPEYVPEVNNYNDNYNTQPVASSNEFVHENYHELYCIPEVESSSAHEIKSSCSAVNTCSCDPQQVQVLYQNINRLTGSTNGEKTNTSSVSFKGEDASASYTEISTENGELSVTFAEGDFSGQDKSIGSFYKVLSCRSCPEVSIRNDCNSSKCRQYNKAEFCEKTSTSESSDFCEREMCMPRRCIRRMNNEFGSCRRPCKPQMDYKVIQKATIRTPERLPPCRTHSGHAAGLPTKLSTTGVADCLPPWKSPPMFANGNRSGQKCDYMPTSYVTHNSSYGQHACQGYGKGGQHYCKIDKRCKEKCPMTTFKQQAMKRMKRACGGYSPDDRNECDTQTCRKRIKSRKCQAGSIGVKKHSRGGDDNGSTDKSNDKEKLEIIPTNYCSPNNPICPLISKLPICDCSKPPCPLPPCLKKCPPDPCCEPCYQPCCPINPCGEPPCQPKSCYELPPCRSSIPCSQPPCMSTNFCLLPTPCCTPCHSAPSCKPRRRHSCCLPTPCQTRSCSPQLCCMPCQDPTCTPCSPCPRCCCEPPSCRPCRSCSPCRPSYPCRTCSPCKRCSPSSPCSPCYPCSPCMSCHPCQPCSPCQPPCFSCSPCIPCKPCSPYDPCFPCPCFPPCQPCNSCSPCQPCGPCSPCSPCCMPCCPICDPCSPCGPCSPCSPCTPCPPPCSPCFPCSPCQAITMDMKPKTCKKCGGLTVTCIGDQMYTEVDICDCCGCCDCCNRYNNCPDPCCQGPCCNTPCCENPCCNTNPCDPNVCCKNYRMLRYVQPSMRDNFRPCLTYEPPIVSMENMTTYMKSYEPPGRWEEILVTICNPEKRFMLCPRKVDGDTVYTLKPKKRNCNCCPCCDCYKTCDCCEC